MAQKSLERLRGLKMKKALITGVTGQDGSYLAELLLSKGYEVWGTLRRSSSINTERIDKIFSDLKLVYADVTDTQSIFNLVKQCQPDEVYNLAAQSHVRTSFDVPHYTANATGLGTLNVLEAVRFECPTARVYQASSSEMFGTFPAPQNEQTPFWPCSPYGISKLYSYWTAVNYRESYGMHASNGILFNHESPRRGDTFVTKKIVKAAVAILRGQQTELRLGNLDAKRDWGFAPEYCQAMHLMLQQKSPGDYVIATGEMHTVREFCDEAFRHVGLDFKKYVVQDTKYFRPTEVNELQGDASRAKRVLGWEPKVRFEELVKVMVEAEIYGE